MLSILSVSTLELNCEHSKTNGNTITITKSQLQSQTVKSISLQTEDSNREKQDDINKSLDHLILYRAV